MAHKHDHDHDHDHEHDYEEIVVLQDEDGNEQECAIYDFELDGQMYAVLFPIHEPDQGGFIYRMETNEDGEEVLLDIEDDEEFERVLAFLKPTSWRWSDERQELVVWGASMPDSVQTVSNGPGTAWSVFSSSCCGELRSMALSLSWVISLSSNDNALSKVVRVQPGMNTRQIAELLEEEGIISNPALFQIMVRLESAEHHLQAGAYLLSPEMRPLEIIDHLRSGRVTTVRVIIPEGFEIKQIAALLAEKGLADGSVLSSWPPMLTRCLGKSCPSICPSHL